MNKEERLMLKNQRAILRALFRMQPALNDSVNDELRKQYSNTNLALVEWEKKK